MWGFGGAFLRRHCRASNNTCLNTMTELCVIQLLFPAMLHKMASDVLRDIDRESGYFYLGPLAAIRLPIPLPDSGD